MAGRQAWIVAIVVAAMPATSRGETLHEGKSAAQLFGIQCGECHKSPRGLAKSGSASSIAGFLREHYTTGQEQAAALANYLLTGAGGAPAAPGTRAAASRGRAPAAAVEQQGSPTAAGRSDRAKKSRRARGEPPVPAIDGPSEAAGSIPTIDDKAAQPAPAASRTRAPPQDIQPADGRPAQRGRRPRRQVSQTPSADVPAGSAPTAAAPVDQLHQVPATQSPVQAAVPMAVPSPAATPTPAVSKPAGSGKRGDDIPD